MTVDDAVTVTSEALGEVTEGCCCERGEAVVTAEEAVAEAVADVVVLEYNGAVLLASLLAGCEPGLPASLYFGMGGLAMEVLKPAGRVVFSDNEAGTEEVVADVKVHSCVVMIVGVGAWAVRD